MGTLANTVSPLTYADPVAPVLERAFINMIELLGGRATLVRLYEQWRAQWPLSGMSFWSSALYWLGVSLEMNGEPWPPPMPSHERLVVIANHPYGLLDGIAICALAESLGRPFRILAHSQLMRVPEAIPYSCQSTSTRTNRRCATTSTRDGARSMPCNPARRS